ncbi:MAG: outer membrane beta-barrel protein [Verrucomicrobiota bacterium]
MTQQHFTLLALVSLLASAQLASAGPITEPVAFEDATGRQFYIFGYGGANWPQGTEGVFPGMTVDLDAATGVVGGGGFGWRLDFLGGSRLEAEGFFRGSDLDDVVVNGVSQRILDNGDHFNSAGVFINFIKEIPIFPNGPITYIGIGGGWSDVEAEARYADELIDEEKEVFIWQAIAGVEFAVTKRLSLFTEYRYVPLTLFSFDRQTPAGDFELFFDDYSNHSVMAGFRFYW